MVQSWPERASSRNGAAIHFALTLLPMTIAALPRKMDMPDATIGYISRRVHGPLILALAKSVGYHDAEVVDLF